MSNDDIKEINKNFSKVFVAIAELRTEMRGLKESRSNWGEIARWGAFLILFGTGFTFAVFILNKIG